MHDRSEVVHARVASNSNLWQRKQTVDKNFDCANLCNRGLRADIPCRIQVTYSGDNGFFNSTFGRTISIGESVPFFILSSQSLHLNAAFTYTALHTEQQVILKGGLASLVGSRCRPRQRPAPLWSPGQRVGSPRATRTAG